MSTSKTSDLFRGYQAVIGIEVHVQLKTKSKIFSADATVFDAADNENTSPVSVGMPGALPVLNEKAVEYAVKTGLALNCHIREKSVFARKNYFYPDLPKGYQISQYDQPICENGYVEFTVSDKSMRVGITRAHLEEDAGKSIHSGQHTLINYNRAGIPLLEIVSEPEIHTPAEAAEYCRTIRSIVRYLDVCDGNLEEGSLRCDCNVSVRQAGADKFGTKVELKNINSFRFVEKAIEYEIHRQIDALENNEKIIQETRLYDPDKNRTFTMRTKEDAQDYRYFPDPDLLPVRVSAQVIESMKKTLPELPLARAKRFESEYNLSIHDAHLLTEEKNLADYFEECGKTCGNFKSVANWMTTELLRELNEHKINIDESKISAKHLAALIKLVDEGTISGKIAKTVFKDMWDSSQDPETIIKDKGLVQVSDKAVIEKIVDQVLMDNPEQVAEFKAGKIKVIAFFVGAIMKASKGKANPALVNEILNQKLSG
ncbi:MAG: Asp-tRNA(Asn)/Glu-tRNA(Gln) amidotransferase subunit GatB [Pseudobdellovibrio sp.]